MKLFAIFVLTVVMFAGCGSNHNEVTQNFIPGLYVKEIKQEFAVGMDSIFINVLDKQASSYSIVRKSSYRQMIDGRILNPKTEVHNWLAYYDTDKNQLIEPNNERVFTFYPDKNFLLMGSSQFRKISGNTTKTKR